MTDLIDRQKIKAKFEPWLKVTDYSEGELNMLKAVLYEITIMPSAQPDVPDTNVGDMISRQAALDALGERPIVWTDNNDYALGERNQYDMDWLAIETVPSVQPTLYGYNLEHLELIARILQKENFPPERVAEALTDIGGIVAFVKDEFEETLRRAVQNAEGGNRWMT